MKKEDKIKMLEGWKREAKRQLVNKECELKELDEYMINLNKFIKDLSEGD